MACGIGQVACRSTPRPTSRSNARHHDFLLSARVFRAVISKYRRGRDTTSPIGIGFTRYVANSGVGAGRGYLAKNVSVTGGQLFPPQSLGDGAAGISNTTSTAR
jgi:hypothetical protein